MKSGSSYPLIATQPLVGASGTRNKKLRNRLASASVPPNFGASSTRKVPSYVMGPNDAAVGNDLPLANEPVESVSDVLLWRVTVHDARDAVTRISGYKP